MDFDEAMKLMYEEQFWNILNKEIEYLYKNNKEYLKYSRICSSVVGENNKLQNVLEDDKVESLSESDVKRLIEYHRADVEKNIIETERMLCAGARNMYFILEKLGLIKKSDSE